LADGGGMALGVTEKARFQQGEISLRAGDTLVLFTDGVTEATDRDDHLFSEERLARELSLHRQYSLRELVNRILDEVHLFAEGAMQADDIALLALRFLGEPAARSRAAFHDKAFTFSGRMSDLALLADAVTAFGKEHAFSDQAIHDVSLAIEEIVCNAIHYGHDDSEDHPIEIRMAPKGDNLTITITDDGKPFNPLDAPAPSVAEPLSERSEGGLGIFLVRKLMDDVQYRRAGNANVLIMRKRVKEQSEA
jgi:sigma-B regulation protein RsbU (phosphoserine phosphatase)